MKKVEVRNLFSGQAGKQGWTPDEEMNKFWVLVEFNDCCVRVARPSLKILDERT